MRKLLLILSLSVATVRSFADEGMWLPTLLGEQVYNEMVKKGLKLTKEQLYSLNKPSIKDGIILFSGFCTGTIVSPEGLFFTNHHCGYESIAAASSMQNNYLKDGFYAKTKQEEIPDPVGDLYAEFLLKIEDVTKEVEEAVNEASGPLRASRVDSSTASISKRFSDPEQGIYARVSSLFRGNQFLVFVYQRYTDLRLVGTPPESIGKFGGDTDNWQWPRHTGDFSIFRIYMGKDGKPADYSPDNIPLKSKYSFPLSIKGFKEGDFTMVWGFPASTNRYETSYGVRQKIEIDNPTIVKLRDLRLKLMNEEMKKDPAVKLQLAGEYAYIANYWKFYDGEAKQLVKHQIVDRKKKDEEAILTWAKGKPEFEKIFNDWQKAYDTWRPYSKHRVFFNEGIMGSPLLAFASTLQKLEIALVKRCVTASELKEAVMTADQYRNTFLKSENQASDRKIMIAILQMFYIEVDKSQHPIGFYESIKGSFGDLKDPVTFSKFVAHVFEGTIILNDAKWKAFVAKPEAASLQNDPAYSTAVAFAKNWQSKYLQHFQLFTARNNELARLYLKAINQKDSARESKMYPDATFTMRLSYGTIKSYNPSEAIKHDYLTTITGVLDKYKPGDYEFDIPQQELELARNKDFGIYIDKVRKNLVVGFITNNDITGGNSGSPVINANGELIGLVFDSNYEALSQKIVFDKDLNRSICLDIRYLLWCIDKLGGAQNLIKELRIIK